MLGEAHSLIDKDFRTVVRSFKVKNQLKFMLYIFGTLILSPCMFQEQSYINLHDKIVC